jgi:transposase
LMRRGLFWLNDKQWACIAQHLPTNLPGPAREDDRCIISGIAHMLQCGARWRDCPPEYGPYTTIYNRFNRWVEACSAFTRVTACTLALSPIRDTHSEAFSYFVTSTAAPVASGWSGRRVGLAPTGKRRPVTAHAKRGRWQAICHSEQVQQNSPPPFRPAHLQRAQRHRALFLPAQGFPPYRQPVTTNSLATSSLPTNSPLSSPIGFN